MNASYCTGNLGMEKATNKKKAKVSSGFGIIRQEGEVVPGWGF